MGISDIDWKHQKMHEISLKSHWVVYKSKLRLNISSTICKVPVIRTEECTMSLRVRFYGKWK